jgi:glycine/D-amino acid oxidase-like deaminating enzyme
MLEELRSVGGRFIQANATAIEKGPQFSIELDTSQGRNAMSADIIVNAAGPFAGYVALMHGETLPVTNIL